MAERKKHHKPKNLALIERKGDPDKALNPQELIFVRQRATGITRAAAARAAGYADPTTVGPNIEKRPHVIKALAIEAAAYAEQANVSRRDVLEGLKKAIEQAVLMADPMAQIAGWRELAKICGYYAPEVKEMRLSTDAQKLLNRYESMSDEALARLAEKEVFDGEYQAVG